MEQGVNERRRVIGYVRVSTDEQAQGGVSLAAQVEKVRMYCDLHGLDLVELIEDAGVSAKTLDRPGLARALRFLDGGDAGGLVVYKLDRLTRSLGDWSGLIDRYFGERAGRTLSSVSESIDTATAGGRMVLNIMFTIAQWERETIVERTRAALDYLRRSGRRISGRLPYGWDLGEDGRTLVLNERERDALATIIRLDQEGLSLRAIARRLDADGVPTKVGGPWAASTIRTLLKRKATTRGEA